MKAAKDIVDKNLSTYKSKASKNKIASYARLYSVEEIKQALYSSNIPRINNWD